jgi:hypothetical protein
MGGKRPGAFASMDFADRPNVNIILPRTTCESQYITLQTN